MRYSSQVIMGMKSRKVKSVGPEEDTERAMSVYRILVDNPEGKNHLGGPRHRSNDNIKINIEEMRYKAVNWMNLVEDVDQWL